MSKPQCFCYFGYYGKDCSLEYDPNKNILIDNDEGFVGVLIFVIILLTLTVSIVIYLILRYTDHIILKKRSFNQIRQRNENKKNKRIIKRKMKGYDLSKRLSQNINVEHDSDDSDDVVNATKIVIT